MLEANLSYLTKRINVEDQVKLLNQEDQLNTKRGINNAEILKHIKFCHEFESSIKDRIEISERKSLRNMIIFIRRCIDVIQFIRAISFEDDPEMFKQMLRVCKKR